MKLDLGPVRSTYVTPTFGVDDKPLDPALARRLRHPMIVGAGFIAAFVVGLGLWASLASFSNGVTAMGQVEVATNKKTLRPLERGTVKQILVKEGQSVTAGQPVIILDDVEPRASVDVYQNQYDTLLAQTARFTAEATGRSQVQFPSELLARISDPRVAALIRDQQTLFAARLQLFQTQSGVYDQRVEQAQTQIEGLKAQVASIDEQARLNQEELSGYQKLEEKGFASHNLVLNYLAKKADFGGRKGQMMADMARIGQQMGETKLQLASLRNDRQSQAAEGVRDSQSKMSDAVPRLTSAKEMMDATVIRTPVAGVVFNLTQFTVGGVVAPGEVLMEVVPSGEPLTVSAMIKPEQVQDVHLGMPARVRLTGLNQRFADNINATVSVISADRVTNEKTGQAFFRVDLRIDPSELKKIKDVRLTPGMPASVTLVAGKRTLMGYMTGPITDTMRDAFRER